MTLNLLDDQDESTSVLFSPNKDVNTCNCLPARCVNMVKVDKGFKNERCFKATKLIYVSMVYISTLISNDSRIQIVK